MWSDIFYPENPKKREKLVRRNQEIKDLMEGNFYATNQLIDVMNEHLSCSFQHIEMNEDATLQENCNVMIECMHKIQAVVEKIDTELKEKLDPTLYEKLLSLSLSPDEFELISKALEAVCGLATLASATVIGLLIDKGVILANITSTFVKIGALTVASLVLEVVFMGIDMIVEAILGSVEQHQLIEALDEYGKALKEFKPASEKYQHSISYVQVKIEEINEYFPA
ncbi:Single-pass membrane and coiled-coil domain-containing protein 3 [Anabarilius grahami]|uniref:Single-pass membrane and coiled-coil domain-containing protein 3 n=1 Tax=Anabarilius grahami TaxID=495550 RepID=A0A3N0XJ72_ANAGA|nr:Single-pass membrane and coiled-coil domain-containing protein 3 [Anabarilius grahami]ROJ30473.1 Single-pass membrane and coiled-coil domain-containing protein 3 [Anabarilius grahami]